MSALRQPDFSSDNYYPQTQLNEVVHPPQPQIVPQSSITKAKVVKPKAFRASNTLPKNLRTLSLLQKGSFGLYSCRSVS